MHLQIPLTKQQKILPILELTNSFEENRSENHRTVRINTNIKTIEIVEIFKNVRSFSQ